MVPVLFFLVKVSNIFHLNLKKKPVYIFTSKIIFPHAFLEIILIFPVDDFFFLFMPVQEHKNNTIMTMLAHISSLFVFPSPVSNIPRRGGVKYRHEKNIKNTVTRIRSLVAQEIIIIVTGT